MLRSVLVIGALAGGLLSSFAEAGQIDDIRARGMFKCGVYESSPGLATINDKGETIGLAADYCRAVAAAILGASPKVEFVKMTFAQGIPAVKSGEVDMADLAITWTLGRNSELGLDFVGPNIFSGLGFMVHKRTGAAKLTDLNGATICVVAGSLQEAQIADYFRARKMTFKPLAIETTAQIYPLYEEGRCDVVTSEPPFLAVRRSRLKNPDDHIILPDLYVKSHMGPIIRRDDPAFVTAAKWAHYALITAEEMGITQANIEQIKGSTNDPGIKRFLGIDSPIGEKMGLANDFAANIVRTVGNYGEVWDRSFGEKSPMKLPRGINALERDGGLQWAPSWR
jgi:general L-amino acid transport system substrate-binding protein